MEKFLLVPWFLAASSLIAQGKQEMGILELLVILMNMEIFSSIIIIGTDLKIIAEFGLNIWFQRNI